MLSTIEFAKITRELGYLKQKTLTIERMLSGQQYVNAVRLNEAQIINAKIGSISASKITTEQLDVSTEIDIGDSEGGDYIKIDGGDINIKMYQDSVAELLIGMQSGTPVIKLGKTGTDVTTDTNPDDYILYVNQTTDYILIKEKARSSASVASGGAGTNIAHGLGYVPLCFVFAEISSGVYKKLFSAPLDLSGYWYEVNSTNLSLRNISGSTKTYYYYIFYDKVV
jgi:hypothetical protein